MSHFDAAQHFQSEFENLRVAIKDLICLMMEKSPYCMSLGRLIIEDGCTPWWVRDASL